MSELDALHGELGEGRRRFLALVADVRPDLHRYCARMTGSVTDGEDLVQDTLARAYYALPELASPPALRPWLFRIAHGRAIDHLRRYERRMGQSLDAVRDTLADGALDPDDALARHEAVHAAIARFLELAPAQRSAVILKDVLGHSLDDIAALLDTTVPAVKAALHRGRTALRAAAEVPAAVVPASPEVARYVSLFNARDWDGVRALLAEDVRLDLVARARRSGRREVGSYTENYAIRTDWHLRPASLDGRAIVAVERDGAIGYLVELGWRDGRVVTIRDFRYVPYIARDAAIVVTG